ncbi:MAG: prolipoprotein diacylglyceryl transferase [Bdellovibrionales bacterium]|nr:prolipoprotein diacylglyceryl transferase [Bdellovibrionales bacterium]
MAKWTYLHNLDPFAIAFTGDFGIRWYGLAYITAFIIGNYFLLELLKRNRTPLSKADVFSLVNYAILGVLIGGRLGHCIFYQPDSWLEWSSEFPFWGVLAIHKGGMASHGGILGVLLAFWLFSYRKKYSLLHLLDLSVIGAGIGFFFGRIANFINGELYGRVIQGSAPFGVQFPQEIFSWFTYWNAEKLLSLKKVVAELQFIKNPYGQGDLKTSEVLWEVWVSSKDRFTAEILSALNQITSAVESGQQEIIIALQEVLPLRHPSQLYQSVLEGLVPLIVVSLLWLKPRKTGVIAGVWGASYFIMRVIGEIFREPDAHIGFGLLGLTRGQWLSAISLIGVGIYFYLIYRRRNELDSY